MKIHILVTAAAAVLLGPAASAKPPAIPTAIYTDPAPDKAHPARMEVVHIPSGGVKINGVAYLASGAGLHPTMVFFHGWPGNEKNLDLAQAVRRAGWNVVTLNYRGSWGSPGNFRFAQNLEDADAALAFVRDPANATKLGIDTKRIVIAGHSMGGWVTAMTAEHDRGIIGAILISAANMGSVGAIPRTELVTLAAGSMESLAGVTAESMADELAANKAAFDWNTGAAGLTNAPLLVLASDDGLAPMTDALVANVRKNGGKQVSTVHVPTDHSWSDKRIRLESEVIRWLIGLRR